MSDHMPAMWTRCTLADCFHIDSGTAPGSHRDDTALVPLMGANGVIGACSIANFGPGYILGRVGAAGSISRVYSRVWASDNTLALTSKSKIDNNFAHYLLMSAKPWELATVTAQPLITQSGVGALRVFLPPFDEQLAIAQILDTLDTAIQEAEAIIAKLKAVKQGLLHDLLTRGIDANGELRPPQAGAPGLYKMSALGWIPREWEASQLNKFVDPRRPIVYGILMPGYGWPGGVPVVKVKDIVDEKIRTDNLLLTSPQIDREYSRSKIQSDDLLFTIRGTVGRTAFVPRELNQANITQDTARLAINCAYARFVRAFLNTPVARRFIEVNTLGVAVQGINLRDVRLIPIAKPPADEAIEISDRLDAAAERIDNESLNLNKLQLAKSGLMDDLLTGRVRVTPLLPAHAEESP